MPFPRGFYLVRVVRVAEIRVDCIVYLSYLRSHVLCAIATLNQNKRSRLLYLSHAQVTVIEFGFRVM